jgi:hypothetical protein
MLLKQRKFFLWLERGMVICNASCQINGSAAQASSMHMTEAVTPI